MNAGLAAYQDSPAAQVIAHQSGIKSGIVRRQNAERLKQLDSILPQILPKLQDNLQTVADQVSDHGQALAMLAGHIARIDADLSKPDLKPVDWRDLSMARERLFNQWAHLAGIPKPMAAREIRTTRRTYAAPAAPVEIPTP